MTIVEIAKTIREALKDKNVQWLIWTFGVILMRFTPDNVDSIIQDIIIAILGIKVFSKKNDD